MIFSLSKTLFGIAGYGTTGITDPYRRVRNPKMYVFEKSKMIALLDLSLSRLQRILNKVNRPKRNHSESANSR
jgi:hypothetical protein